MLDTLAVINRVIAEHRLIRGDLKTTGASMADIEALFALHKATAGWSQSSIREIEDKKAELLDGVDWLWQGLKRHFGFEERALPGVIEEAVMKTIIQDHKKIAVLIDQIKTFLAEGLPEGGGQKEMLKRKATIQENIRHITEVVEEHSQYEEIILNKMKKALEASTVQL